jgi:hypothetical protein
LWLLCVTVKDASLRHLFVHSFSTNGWYDKALQFVADRASSPDPTGYGLVRRVLVIGGDKVRKGNKRDGLHKAGANPVALMIATAPIAITSRRCHVGHGLPLPRGAG